jgi:hypothetical protein
MSSKTPSFRAFASACLAWSCVVGALGACCAADASTPLPSSPDAYLRQADGVRRALDRPWQPVAGRLGNLRHVHLIAPDCVVRVVSGNENRVYAGSREVVVHEQSRVLDADPHERPTPRDVVLSTGDAPSCSATATCGVSTANATRAPRLDGAAAVCFTLQLATAHDLLLRGDGLTLLVDRVRQPALRLSVNPSDRLRIWFEQVDLGLLSIRANAPVNVGGRGRIDYLQGESSNRGSVMYLHEFDARHVGVSTTTTGTQWSVRIGAETQMAGYYQPARAPGGIAKQYGIEVDGPLERLEVPASRIDPRPLSAATRVAARALRDAVLAQAGPTPALPASELVLPSAAAAAAALPRDPRQQVADVVARYLPATIRITEVDLWKRGGRVEGIAPDVATARDVVRRLTASGEFTHVSGGGGMARDGGFAFSALMHFPCEAPGAPSECAAGDPKARGAYSEMQVIETLEGLLGPEVPLHDARLDGITIRMQAAGANPTEVRAALERIKNHAGLFRVSISGLGPSRNGATTEIDATLKLLCVAPPKPDGICAVPPAATMAR